MKIAVHDYVGHPFQLELSSALASRGHEVSHLYCDTLEGGQASFAVARQVNVVPVSAPATIDKGAVVSRFRNEYAYGSRLRRQLQLIDPDVVISANAPTHVQMQIQGLTRTRSWRNVLWVQDLYGLAIKSVYSRRNQLLGSVVSAPFTSVDRRLLGSADHVVLISEGFGSAVNRPTDDPGVTVIENWSPLDAIPVVDKENRWSHAADSVDSFNFLYSGTLGMKHEPRFLVALARAMSQRARVIVVASGVSMDWLRGEIDRHDIDNLSLHDPVPFEDVPFVQGSGDVLVVLLERDAGAFSVPSKVLSYLCAGRPILGSLPASNLARQIIDDAEAGLTVDPGDIDGFVAAANTLLNDAALRAKMAANGRDYAERTFDIERIADQWERVLESVVAAS